MQLVDATPFQLTRNSDFESASGDEVEDLLRTIEVEIRKRRRGAAVRLCLAEDAPLQTEAFLKAQED